MLRPAESEQIPLTCRVFTRLFTCNTPMFFLDFALFEVQCFYRYENDLASKEQKLLYEVKGTLRVLAISLKNDNSSYCFIYQQFHLKVKFCTHLLGKSGWISQFFICLSFLIALYSNENRSTEGCSKLKRSIDMTSLGKDGLNIRTHASPKWERIRCPEE